MKCYLVQQGAEARESRVLVQYDGEWTEEDASQRLRREPGRIPSMYLSGRHVVSPDEAESVLGRQIEWLSELPEPRLSTRLARTTGGVVLALLLWAALSLAIVALVWSPTSFWRVLLVPIYLPAPVAAFVCVLVAGPKARSQSVKLAIALVVLGYVLCLPIPHGPLLASMSVFVRNPAEGFGYALMSSLVFVGIAYCGASAYLGARLAEAVASRKSSR